MTAMDQISLEGSNSVLELPLSVLVVGEGDGSGVAELLGRYRSVLDARGQAYEFIFVFDNQSEALHKVADELGADWSNFKMVPQRPWSGEDHALKIGLDRTIGETVLTLPCWSETDPEAINTLLDAAQDTDMVTGKRIGVQRSAWQNFRASATHQMLRVLFQQKFEDVFCRAKAGKREVFLRSAEFGVRQHYLPLIAVSEGYRVREVDLPMDNAETSGSVYRFKPNAHVGAFADALTLFIALKFLKRPLRFFGAVGVPLIAIGLVLTAWLAVERLLIGTPLADRPALVFSVMTLVLGIQILALGLVGEIIIFSTSRKMRSYEIDHIIRGRPQDHEESGADVLVESADPPKQDKK